MELRIRSTGAVMFESELRAYLLANGGPSYETLTPEVMEAIGVDPVFEGAQATGGTVYQYSMRDGVEQQADGKWYTSTSWGRSSPIRQKLQRPSRKQPIRRRRMRNRLKRCGLTGLRVWRRAIGPSLRMPRWMIWSGQFIAKRCAISLPKPGSHGI